MKKAELEKLETRLLLEAVKSAYGYDFSQYAQASLKRRLNGFMSFNNIKGYLHLAGELLHNAMLFDKFLKHMSITVTEMFRDPKFYVSFRQNVLPVLQTYPFVKIWHAGCATG